MIGLGRHITAQVQRPPCKMRGIPRNIIPRLWLNIRCDLRVSRIRIIRVLRPGANLQQPAAKFRFLIKKRRGVYFINKLCCRNRQFFWLFSGELRKTVQIAEDRQGKSIQIFRNTIIAVWIFFSGKHLSEMFDNGIFCVPICFRMQQICFRAIISCCGKRIWNQIHPATGRAKAHKLCAKVIKLESI